MPLSSNYHSNARALAGMRQGHNPDGRQDDRGLEMSPQLYAKMLRGEITPEEAQKIWSEREPRLRAANDEIRRRAGVGYAADAESLLAQEGQAEGKAPTLRDNQSGQFASLDEAAREAGHQPAPGSIVPSERVQPPDANELLRRDYGRVLANRGEGN